MQMRMNACDIRSAKDSTSVGATERIERAMPYIQEVGVLSLPGVYLGIGCQRLCDANESSRASRQARAADVTIENLTSVISSAEWVGPWIAAGHGPIAARKRYSLDLSSLGARSCVPRAELHSKLLPGNPSKSKPRSLEACNRDEELCASMPTVCQISAPAIP